MKRKLIFAAIINMALLSSACAQQQLPFNVEPVAKFDKPWAFAFLPDGKMLVTEKQGKLFLVTQTGQKSQPIRGVPDVDYGGQGGLGDVVLHPDFEDNGLIYLSYAEAGTGDTRGAAIMRAQLVTTDSGAFLQNQEVIWRQYPKVVGYGHYGHRMVFGENGFLWVSSGDRQKFTPAQDVQSNMGKVLRLNEDGSSPEDNPFVDYNRQNPLADDEGVFGEIWSLGHRNPLGLAFDLQKQLWVIEMGPAGGDELNRVVRAGNYGYPVVSNGDHYDGREIPDHETRPEFVAPAAWWTPVISPSDLQVYDGKLFADWYGNLLATGLSSRSLVRIAVDGDTAKEVERFDMGARIRSVEQGPDGSIWLLEDDRNDSRGRLLKLTPKE